MKFLNEIIKEITPEKEILRKINLISEDFQNKLEKKLKNKKIDAKVFLGGSFAKKSVIKKDNYDLDFFIRFSKKYSNKEISKLLEKILDKNVKKIHGSRDYFQKKNNSLILEIIPVLKINKPEEAKNITDLSYFHVKYVLKKLNKKLSDEIKLAKAFAEACGCYGAESYINGFSGYSLELLIIHYKNFLNFIKKISESEEKIIIDSEKQFKNKNYVLKELNSSKLKSPIIIIDPTFKERNVCAGLSNETFDNFKDYCKKFLKNPSKNFFYKKPVSEKFEKIKNILKIKVKTKKQAGDIAGTKSKKFYKYFIERLKEEFKVINSGFYYDENKNEAIFYVKLNKKQDEIIKGPHKSKKEHFKKFQKINKDTFKKNDYIYCKKKHNYKFGEWFKKFKKNEKILNQMSIKEIRLI